VVFEILQDQPVWSIALAGSTAKIAMIVLNPKSVTLGIAKGGLSSLGSNSHEEKKSAARAQPPPLTI